MIVFTLVFVVYWLLMLRMSTISGARVIFLSTAKSLLSVATNYTSIIITPDVAALLLPLLASLKRQRPGRLTTAIK